MYACVIYFTPENQSKLLELIHSDVLARMIDFKNEYVCIRTRKLWKLYWFNFRYRHFQREFSYSEFFGPTRKLVVSNYIKDNYYYDIFPFDGYTQEFIVLFPKIKHVWRIKLAFFLKK